jgi:ABC-2 type transport system permease protein
MNYSMVKLLILKDWYLQRISILIALAGGAAALTITASLGNAGLILGIILLVTVLISIGVQLAVATIINERQQQTLTFVMSLPISPREYTASKILGSLLIFLIPWVALVAATIGVMLFKPGMPRGAVPYVSIMAAEILVSTCLIIATAIVTDSQRWTIGVMMVGNFAFNAFGYYVAHIPSIAAVLEGRRVIWSPAALTLLAAEFISVVLLLSLTFFIQDRKTDFI